MRIDEREVVAVGVAELERAAVGVQHLHGLGRVEALVERAAVPEVAELGLDEGAQVARRAVLGFHHQVRLVVELDHLAFAEVVGGRHGRLRREGLVL